MARRSARKATRWATPESLIGAMASMRPEHQQCRTFRHSMALKPNSYRHSVTGSVIVTLYCTRCDSYEKDVEYNASGGDIVTRGSGRYDKDKGYLLQGVGRIGSDVQGLLFEEVAQRELRSQVESSPRPRRARKGDAGK